MADTVSETGNLRLDKLLWYARFLKSRSLAAKLCEAGKIRINGSLIKKARHVVRVGDVLTFPLTNHVRVIEVVELGTRRGPAVEAVLLYKDLSPPQKPEKDDKSTQSGFAVREPGAGRPTKAERRALDRLRENPEDL